MEENVFYPISQCPDPDESDASFSKTVIIYDTELKFTDLGYFDFEVGQWSHFGKNTFLLKCWCYIPDPKQMMYCREWISIEPKGYKKDFF